MNLIRAPRKWFAFSALALAAGLAAYGRAQAEAPDAPTAAPKAIEIAIVNRKPVGGVRTVRLHRGESVVLKIRSDEKLSVHVHGYDARQGVTPDAEATLPIVAKWEGRFPVSAHLPEESGRHGPEPTLLYLEVYPD